MRTRHLFVLVVALATQMLLAASTAVSAQAPHRPMTAATYNIHHGVGVDGQLDLERIADELRATGADIIGLQEVDRHWSARSDWADQATELAESLGMRVVYGANLDRDPPEEGAPRRQYGTAILSAFPIREASNTPLPNLGGEQRGLLEALVEVRGVPMRVLNTHLQHDSATERAAQTQAIADRLDEIDEPVVLLGDLNASPDAQEMGVLQARLDDAWELGGDGDGFTYPADNPDRRIDYAMVSRDVDVTGAAVRSTLASDHLPMSASLLLPGSAVGRSRDTSDVTPLARAHAHNDYEHDRPLLDALDHGFTSVEADVWLVNGELLVAHDLHEVQPGRTLESLYLDPLVERVRANRGSVYAGWPHSLQLLVDIKSEAGPTYLAVHETLRRYRSILTQFTPGGANEGAVTAVMSGNRPRELMASQPVRYAAYDGRLPDLDSGSLATFIPLISDNWTNHFSWQGVGEMPEVERQKLDSIVDTAHANGQRVRFWETPDDEGRREAVWEELVAAGVDYLNTDHLEALRDWLLVNDPHPSKPEVDWFQRQS